MNDMVAKFIAYHTVNPHVYDVFKQLVQERLARKKTRLQSTQLMCFLRERFEMQVEGDFEFKINQIFGAAYVRMFELEYPNHVGLFKKKVSRFDDYDMAPMLEHYKLSKTVVA